MGTGAIYVCKSFLTLWINQVADMIPEDDCEWLGKLVNVNPYPKRPTYLLAVCGQLMFPILTAVIEQMYALYFIMTSNGSLLTFLKTGQHLHGWLLLPERKYGSMEDLSHGHLY